MSVKVVADVNNAFLSRREITCDFAGLAGSLRKLDAVDMVTKELEFDGKVVVPISLSTHIGKTLATGIFYVYDDEDLARRHINPSTFARLDKARAKKAEAAEGTEAAEPDNAGGVE